MEKSDPSLMPAHPPATTPWILVVDDESAILRLIETILQAEGWTAFVVDTGKKALTALKAAKHPPAVVICDVLMPRIDGLELTRRMLARVPELKVIHISGHLTDLSWWPTDMREYRFLAKPFLRADLIAIVEEALADSSPSR
ncbi:MAG: response regulator [Opitutaceae bacterium]|nr:response regulator [Opitutaceae bacterium]